MSVINGVKQGASGADTVMASAVFFDQRDTGVTGGPCGTADKWWTRLLNVEDYNDISSNVELLVFAITEADTGANTYKVAADQTAYFPVGHRFSIQGSTGNNTGNTPDVVTAVSFAAGFTTISTTSVVDATTDGTITSGMFKFLKAANYTVRGAASTYKMNGADVRLVEITGFTYTAGYVNATGGTKTDPLAAIYSATASDVIVTPPFNSQLTPSADSVWEMQSWVEATSGGASSLGGRDTAGLSAVRNFAHLAISTAV